METTAFSKITRVLFITAFQTVTLDADVVGTRSHDNQVKFLSPRKSAKEGKMADNISDALFHVVLSVRFGRRGGRQESSTSTTIGRILEDQEQLALSSLTWTADRGYGRDSPVVVRDFW